MNARREEGFALITALWALALVGALAGAYLSESRHVVRVSENRNALLKARQASLGGLARAHNALERLHALSLEGATALDVASQARLTAVWNHLQPAFAEIATGCLGDACYRVEVRDLGTLLNVNLLSESQLRRFFLALGIDYREADIAAQSIADWIDADDLHRVRGAERGYYLALPMPYEPRNAAITDLSELQRVRGLDGRLYDLAIRYLSVEGDGSVNLNAAPEPVLVALPGLGPEALRVIIDSRRRGVVITSLLELARRLSPNARELLESNMSELMRRTIFEPQQIEVLSTGRFADSGVRVAFRSIYVRSGDRVARLKRVRCLP